MTTMPMGGIPDAISNAIEPDGRDVTPGHIWDCGCQWTPQAWTIRLCPYHDGMIAGWNLHDEHTATPSINTTHHLLGRLGHYWRRLPGDQWRVPNGAIRATSRMLSVYTPVTPLTPGPLILLTDLDEDNDD